MKCSNYLWLYKKIYAGKPEGEHWSPERAQGETRLIMGDELITNDITGEVMSEREAFVVFNHHMDELNKAFNDNDRNTFTDIVVKHFNENTGETEGEN